MNDESEPCVRSIDRFRMHYCRRKPGSGLVPPLPRVWTDPGYIADRRKHPQLTQLIDDYLAKGWEITGRNPLTIHRGRAGWQLRNWCLSSL